MKDEQTPESPTVSEPIVETPDAAGEVKKNDENAEPEKEVLTKEPAETTESGSAGVQVKTGGDVNANTVNVGENIFQILTSDKSYFERDKIRPFQKADDCLPIDLGEDEELNIYEFDEAFIAESLNVWLTKRILVVAGKPNIGKVATAKHLCRKLDEVPSLTGKKQHTYLVKPLKTGVKLNLLEVAKDAGGYAHNTLIFKNAFAGGNLDLNDFFADLDYQQLKALIAALEENEMYFIFTTNTEMICACELNLQKLNILAAQPLLSKERLQSSFKKKVDLFSVTRNRAPEEIESLLEREREEFDKLFITQQVPGIVEFIDRYLEPILNNEINVREAIEGLEHLDNWFLDELTKQPETEASREAVYLNFETWCFVLTLTLTQCTRETTDSASLYEGVPWMFFEQFREKITQALMEKLGICYPRKITLRNYISEQNWLKKGGAEIYKDVDFGIDMIRFENEQYPEKMWKVLLKSTRRTLFLLIPMLVELAEVENPGVRSLAARILGRIGEIDIEEITLKLAEEWINSSPRQMATVGYLYEGIQFSRNDNYRKRCRAFLEDMPYKYTSSAGRGQEKIHRGLWTAIATYKQIGKHTLPSAMKQLQKISEFALTGQAELEKQFAKLPSQISKSIEKELKENVPGWTEADFKSASYQSLRESVEKEAWKRARKALSDLYKENPYFNVFKYTLISLCLNVSPLKVLNELHKWFDSDNEELKMFVALNFLREEGIAESLSEFEVPVSPANLEDNQTRVNPVIDEMASSENSVQKMARFLEDIFCAFDIPASPLVRFYYRQQFFQLLKQWAKESVASARHQEIMVNLFAAFLDSLIEELAGGLNNLIRDDADFSDEKNPLYSFREKVFEKSMSL
jgi:hypothetical protein